MFYSYKEAKYRAIKAKKVSGFWSSVVFFLRCGDREIYKVWWLREASQIGKRSYPMWKSRLKHSTAEFQSIQQILAAIGHRFIAK